jgi:hypothetical protein
MTISSDHETKLNKMNKAAQNVSLGTIIAGLQNDFIASGSLAVSAAQANGSSVTIYTGLTSTVTGYQINVFRSGSALSSDPYVYASGGSVIITPGASYAVTTADRINWIAFS